MSQAFSAATMQIHGCTVDIRRVQGAVARELFIRVQPPHDAAGVSEQTRAVYRALLTLLDDEGSGIDALLSETVYLRDIRSDLEGFRQARNASLSTVDGFDGRPATLEIGQTPVEKAASLELAAQCLCAPTSPMRVSAVEAGAADKDTRHRGLCLALGDEKRLYAGGLCGYGTSAHEQTLGMFGLAEELLGKAGMDFSDVVRAWIHLREMERDYPALNQARREFFVARGIDPVPASTGIGGCPASAEHDLCLSIYAVKGARAPQRTVMTSPTLNEAGEYGADFVRGMRMVETNKVALHISGTASVDETGSTAHVGDFEAQAERMLVNVAALLARQGAGFEHIVSAVTYVKDPADAQRLEEKFRKAGYRGFPNILVAAEVCRPELLCETEALAVLPH